MDIIGPMRPALWIDRAVAALLAAALVTGFVLIRQRAESGAEGATGGVMLTGPGLVSVGEPPIRPAPAPAPAAPVNPTAAARDLAAGIALDLAEGNPEVRRHRLYRFGVETGCRASQQARLVPSGGRAEGKAERAARKSTLAALRDDPAVAGAAHASRASSAGRWHVIVAVGCT